MGRRSVRPPEPSAGRPRAPSRHLDTDHARLAAQRHEVQLVEFMADTALDPAIEDLRARRRLALDVLERARGRPGIRIEAPRAEPAPSPRPNPETLRLGMEAHRELRLALDRHRELSRWAAIPASKWPGYVREMHAAQEEFLARLGADG
jgi:hypothetical protein